MKLLAYSIVAAACVGTLSHCNPKESSNRQEDRASKQGSPSKGGTRPPSRPADSGRDGKDFKDTRGLAMNRNEATHNLLSATKPDWLSIGAPASTELLPDKQPGTAWREVGTSKITFSAGATLSKIGDLELPASLAATEWAAASFAPGNQRLLMLPLEQTEPASLYKVENGKILEDSREELPSINYDDKRRWFIQWEAWVSDSEILGVFNEEDISGHTIARSGLYLYDVNARELRRVDLPYGLITGNDPAIEIVSVSPEGFLIRTANGEKTVMLKR